MTQLGYLDLDVSDIAAWEPFATDVLGLEVAATSKDGTVLLRLDERDHRIALRACGLDDLTSVGWDAHDE